MLKSLIEIPQLQISNLTFYTKKSLSQELLFHCRLYILRLLFIVFTICKSILTFRDLQLGEREGLDDILQASVD